MPLARFKPATPVSDWPQTLALDCSATGIGGIRSPDRPACSQSLYRLRYPGPQTTIQCVIEYVIITFYLFVLSVYFQCEQQHFQVA